MAAVSEKVLRRFVNDASVIVTNGSGPCPVFARGDRRTVATHWLPRDIVRTLQADGILTPVPRGLIVSQAIRAQLRNPN